MKKRFLSLMLTITLVALFSLPASADSFDNTVVQHTEYTVETDKNALLTKAIQESLSKQTRASSPSDDEIKTTQKESTTVYSDGTVIETYRGDAFLLVHNNQKVTAGELAEHSDSIQDGYLNCYASVTVYWQHEFDGHMGGRKINRVYVTPNNYGGNRITSMRYGIIGRDEWSDPNPLEITTTVSDPSSGVTLSRYNYTDRYFSGGSSTTSAGADEFYVNGSYIYGFSAIYTVI